MKESYLTINNIDQGERALDVVKMILDQNYDILGENFRDQMTRHFLKEYKQASVYDQECINDFELEQHEASINRSTWRSKVDHAGGVAVSTFTRGTREFNGEELLFLNRISFYLLSLHGRNLKFKLFIDTLILLQDGTLTQKIELVCQMLKEGRNMQKMIQVEHLVHFFTASMP